MGSFHSWPTHTLSRVGRKCSSALQLLPLPTVPVGDPRHPHRGEDPVCCRLRWAAQQNCVLGGFAANSSSRRARDAHPYPQKQAAATLTEAFVAPTARPALCSRGQGCDGGGAAHLQRHAGAAGGGGGGARTVSTLVVPIHPGGTCHGGAEVGARVARANFNDASWRRSSSLVRGMHACAASGLSRLSWPQQARKPEHLCPASPGSRSPANPCDQTCTTFPPCNFSRVRCVSLTATGGHRRWPPRAGCCHAFCHPTFSHPCSLCLPACRCGDLLHYHQSPSWRRSRRGCLIAVLGCRLQAAAAARCKLRAGAAGAGGGPLTASPQSCACTASARQEKKQQ